jgi:hypothetical protein
MDARNGEVELRSVIAGYYPTLAARPGAPAWTGEVYNQVQARLHARVSHRYFRHLARTAAEGGSRYSARRARSDRR